MIIPELLPIWQPQGSSTHIIAKKIAEKYGVKTSHTGTLDPMAEGVIIVLLGENRHKKYEFAAWEKEYEFEIAFGIKTDTFDGLGIITDIDFPRGKLSFEQVSNAIKSFAGDYSQKVPAYSAIEIRGKPMHWYARNNKLDEIEMPQRSGTVFDIELISLTELPIKTSATQIIEKIKRVEGDLRQKEAISGWKDTEKKDSGRSIQIAKIKVKMSKGLYVRTLSQDISEKLGFIGFTHSIVRTANGTYNRENSYSPEEILVTNKVE